MNHETQARRLRSERPDTKPEPAKPDAQVRLQERPGQRHRGRYFGNVQLNSDSFVRIFPEQRRRALAR
jgi:hypothetical protein